MEKDRDEGITQSIRYLAEECLRAGYPKTQAALVESRRIFELERVKKPNGKLL